MPYARNFITEAKKPSKQEASNPNTSPETMPVIIEEPQPSTSSAPTPPSPFDKVEDKEAESNAAETSTDNLHPENEDLAEDSKSASTE